MSKIRVTCKNAKIGLKVIDSDGEVGMITRLSNDYRKYHDIFVQSILKVKGTYAWSSFFCLNKKCKLYNAKDNRLYICKDQS